MVPPSLQSALESHGRRLALIFTQNPYESEVGTTTSGMPESADPHVLCCEYSVDCRCQHGCHAVHHICNATVRSPNGTVLRYLLVHGPIRAILLHSREIKFRDFYEIARYWTKQRIPKEFFGKEIGLSSTMYGRQGRHVLDEWQCPI